MKKLFLLIFMISSLSVLGHPPGSITTDYDNETKTLTVEIMHGVRNIEKHYIEKVEIYINGEKRVSQNYKKQFDKGKQLAKYIFPEIEMGSMVKIETNCSVYGGKSEEIKIK